MKDETVARLEAELDRVLTTLVAAANGSRTTLRIDDQARGWNVNVHLRGGAQARHQVTARRRIDRSACGRDREVDGGSSQNLVQPDIINNPDPAPPPALMSAYAAKAQMLAPLFNQTGYLQGWISVHYVDGTHEFTDAEIAALDRAATEVRRLTSI